MSTIDEQLERLITMVSGLATATEKNTHDISRLLNISTQHQQSIEAHQQRFDAVINELQRQGEDVREMQSEVRGLQTENRRILDQLINREGA
jgi:hypothetical protein